MINRCTRFCWLRVVAAIGSAASAWGLPCSFAEEAVWRFEKFRVEQALCAGDFEKARNLATSYEEEFDRVKKSYKSKSKWSDYEWNSIDNDLLIGTVERVSGNYGQAQSRFDQALAELKQIRQRNLRLFLGARAAAEKAAMAAALASEAGQLQFFGLLNGHAQIWMQGVLAQRVASQMASEAAGVQANAGKAADIVAETETRAVEVFDALGALAIDRALPLGASSTKLLKVAEGHFRAAQETSERRSWDAESRPTIHGTRHNTFLLNYGNLYLKRAELAMVMGDDDVDGLLERAEAYFDQAEESFSELRSELDGFKGLVFSGNVGDIKKRIIRKICEDDPKANLAGVRRALDQVLLEIQGRCLGDADIHFKQSELELARLRYKIPNNPGPLEFRDRMEQFDETEQRLLNAIDRIKLIGDGGDHPFLVLPCALIVVLEATRSEGQVRKPDERYFEFMKTADSILQQRRMPAQSKESVYLEEARRAWAKAGGKVGG